MANTPGIRDPGSLPNVYARVERARALLSKGDLDPDLRSAIEAFLALAQTQAELNKRLWEAKKGLAEPHAYTHMGADDSVEGRQLPSEITFSATGAIGDPTLGYAPIGHIHDTDGITKNRTVGLSIYAVGQTVTTGFKRYSPPIPFSGTIVGWDVVASKSGSIVVDVWKDTWANFPPTVADTIAGAEKPTLVSQQKNQDLDLTTWTTDVAVGDVFGFYVDSVSLIEKIVVQIRITPTS